MNVRLHAVETSADAISATTLNAYVDLGVGPDASNVSVIAENLGAANVQGIGVVYYLPLYANLKTYRLWARHQNTAASAKIGVQVTYNIGRRSPGSFGELVKKVVGLGAVAASTTGTSITPGAPSPGAWTEIIASTTERYVGVMASPLFNVDTSLSSALLSFAHVGIGGSGSELAVAYNAMAQLVWSTAEQKDAIVLPTFVGIPSGSRLSARVTGSTTADGTNSIMLYGLVA
jgi:hypothetical protein